jgi:predicted MFS family arabinose efflux permease
VSSATSGYRSLLRVPGAAAFFFPAAVGRAGIAMTGLSLIWLVHARTGSYGTAGLATAGFAVAEALIGPQLARLIDHFGQTRVLPFSLLTHGLAVAGVLTATSPAIVLACATCAGAAVPQLGALSAARWAYLLHRGDRAGELPAAFSLESLANATAFLVGPALAAALGAAGEAPLGSAVAAALILGGGGALAAQSCTAPPPARQGTERAGTERALLHPAFLLVVLLNVAVGLYFGTLSISVSAFATRHGEPAAAVAILAAASLSGLLSGWLYGRRRHRAPAHRQLVIASSYLTCTGLLLPLAPSPLWLGLAAALTEAAVPPTLVLLNVLTEQSVRRTALTQALTWNNSASAAGSALAGTLAGHAADHLGTSAAFALAPVAGLLLLVLSVTARQRAARDSRPVP